jgi:hypothetical protein
MQFLPIIVVLGGVSWMVCAVSLQGETGNRVFWPGRLGEAAHRATLGMGVALRTRVPAAKRAVRGRSVGAARAAFRAAIEIAHGLPAAVVSIRDGFREDAAAIREWGQAGRDRLAPAILRLAAARQAPVERATARQRERAVWFAETLSMTWVEHQAAQELDLPADEEEEEDERHIRGVLGLILLIALVGFLIAAGLMSVAWGVKHLIVLRRTG